MSPEEIGEHICGTFTMKINELME
jgi:hypothetical protein